jgi:hypothetical protein
MTRLGKHGRLGSLGGLFLKGKEAGGPGRLVGGWKIWEAWEAGRPGRAGGPGGFTVIAFH